MKTNFFTDVLQSHDDGFGGWAFGSVWVGNREFGYQVKHFEEGSKFGINGGRISKLFLVRRYPNRNDKSVCGYDRGWCGKLRPFKAVDVAAYNALLERYN